MNILLFLLGLAIGLLVMWIVYSRAKSAHMRELQAAETRAQVLEAQIESERRHTEAAHSQAFAAQEARFAETLARVTSELKAATDEMLKQRQQEFSQSSSRDLGQIVTPLRETIESMRNVMNASTLHQTELSSSMKEQIRLLMQQSEAARRSAEELTRVFKHGSKVQGDWGETILSELLDSQGLTCGVHYDVQTTMRNADGRVLKSEQGSMMRPDVILHLDHNREVIIDSKVSLTAFMDYVNAETEEERELYLKAHIDSLQKHVRELAAKDYSSYIRLPKTSVDYVIMFVPHSGALWTAIGARPDLWRWAMERNVFIADEQTLYAALRIVSLTWTQIAQAENHERVYALANEMLERVGLFYKKYAAIGKALEAAGKAYDDADKKLQPSGPSILQTCYKLQKLGAKQSNTSPLPQIDCEENILSQEKEQLPQTEDSLPSEKEG